MTAAAPPRCYTSPFTSEDQQRIREELAYLLSTTHFTGSKRYPAFLKWTVDKTLAGDIADLKERTIGVELFGKSPDYDTSNDTIVRFTGGRSSKTTLPGLPPSGKGHYRSHRASCRVVSSRVPAP